MKIIYFIVFVLPALFLNPQFTFCQQVVFNEDFDNNNNNWPITRNFGNHSYIADGIYHVEIKVGNILLDKLITMDFNETRDFVIEAEIKRLAGTAAYGITWGARGEGSRFNFIISDSGRYAINKWDNYLPTPLVKYTYSKYVKSDSVANKLSIKKEKNKLFFFINDKYVTQVPFQKFYGHQAGIYSGSGYLVLEINYLRIYYPSEED